MVRHHDACTGPHVISAHGRPIAGWVGEVWRIGGAYKDSDLLSTCYLPTDLLLVQRVLLHAQVFGSHVHVHVHVHCALCMSPAHRPVYALHPYIW